MLKHTGKAVFSAVLTSLIAVAATSAMAETKFEQNHPRRDQVNDRLQNQDRRIHHEVQEGEMSKQQARRLHKDDRHIRHEEQRMAARNGGAITKQEQNKLNRQENGVSRQIGK
ncbi:MAG: hypothetical protein HKM00_02905 [Gallionella sp.]|nr:hypothetical protein [Gallionella sp.]